MSQRRARRLAPQRVAAESGARPAPMACVVDWAHYALDYDWREAQAEANLAYRSWSLHLGHDEYAVYRAAQDRADSAQDALARYVRERRAREDSGDTRT